MAALTVYEQAIENGQDEDAAYEAACAAYREAHPRIAAAIVRRIVAVVVGRANSWSGATSSHRDRPKPKR